MKKCEKYFLKEIILNITRIHKVSAQHCEKGKLDIVFLETIVQIGESVLHCKLYTVHIYEKELKELIGS